jgi:hypothetical protein
MAFILTWLPDKTGDRGNLALGRGMAGPLGIARFPQGTIADLAGVALATGIGSPGIAGPGEIDGHTQGHGSAHNVCFGV